MKTNLIPLFREIFLNYNKNLPYLFLGTYFEEVADGFLVICHDVIDLSFIFRKDNAPDGAKKWFNENHFKLPSDFYENSLGWAIDKLKKIGFYV